MQLNHNRRKRLTDVRIYQATKSAIERVTLIPYQFGNRDTLVLRPLNPDGTHRDRELLHNEVNSVSPTTVASHKSLMYPRRDTENSPSDFTQTRETVVEEEEHVLREAALLGTRLLRDYLSQSAYNHVPMPGILGGAEVDPFLTGGLPLAREANRLVFHYLDFNTSILPIHQQRVAHLHWVLSLALNQPHTLYSVLALSAAYRAGKEGELGHGTRVRGVLSRSMSLTSNRTSLL